jgi:hypothetical protein
MTSYGWADLARADAVQRRRRLNHLTALFVLAVFDAALVVFAAGVAALLGCVARAIFMVLP